MNARRRADVHTSVRQMRLNFRLGGNKKKIKIKITHAEREDVTCLD